MSFWETVKEPCTQRQVSLRQSSRRNNLTRDPDLSNTDTLTSWFSGMSSALSQPLLSGSLYINIALSLGIYTQTYFIYSFLPSNLPPTENDLSARLTFSFPHRVFVRSTDKTYKHNRRESSDWMQMCDTFIVPVEPVFQSHNHVPIKDDDIINIIILDA